MAIPAAEFPTIDLRPYGSALRLAEQALRAREATLRTRMEPRAAEEVAGAVEDLHELRRLSGEVEP